MHIYTDYIFWKDKQKSEIRGGELMFNIHGHYKWMNEIELYQYYLKFIQ